MIAMVVLAILGLPFTAFGADGHGSALTVGWALLLGAVQGITEFLPISSDGHLALGQALLGLDPESAGHRFTITVHGGTLLAVLWTYRDDLLALTKAALRPTHDSNERRLLVAMLVASVPLGLVLLPGVENAIIAMESQIRVVGVCLWVTGAVLWIGFRHERKHPPREPGRLPTPLQGGSLDPWLITNWIDRSAEAQPWWVSLVGDPTYPLAVMVPVLVALAVAGWSI
ncbi:MAG TPA: undecaprenyl-diphosphate phosphatase, partial [Nannocystaceae bacterium]|nr:undecaprenyl-diphosphate phosphatase [Nannocystaceae bacterium]